MDLVRPGLPAGFGCHVSIRRLHFRSNRQTICRPRWFDLAYHRHDHLRDGAFDEHLH